jgi:hypothetical protein
MKNVLTITKYHQQALDFGPDLPSLFGLAEDGLVK